MEAAERYMYQESLIFVRQQTAICECEYADAYNHSCLMLSYSTSEVCQSGRNGKIVAEANEDIKKVLLQRFVLIIKSICYFETVIFVLQTGYVT